MAAPAADETPPKKRLKTDAASTGGSVASGTAHDTKRSVSSVAGNTTATDTATAACVPPSVAVEVVKSRATNWSPAATGAVKVALNIELDATPITDATATATAATATATAAAAPVVRTANLVVLDDTLFGESERAELLSFVTSANWDHAKSGPGPTDKWERATSDGPELPHTWGLRPHVLNQFGTAGDTLKSAASAAAAPTATNDTAATATPSSTAAAAMPAPFAPPAPPHTAILEIGARLKKLYPEMIICHQPMNQYFTPAGGGGDPLNAKYECSQFVVNAPVASDAGTFHWHVDADPASFPDSCAFTRRFGSYVNHEPGRPLFVSLLLYLNGTDSGMHPRTGLWPRSYDAETLFLDPDTECGVFVRPRRYRAVLMDQDMLHRVSTPGRAAGELARYSFVWKLLFVPRSESQVCTIAKPEWGKPTRFGSAAAAASAAALSSPSIGASPAGTGTKRASSQ